MLPLYTLISLFLLSPIGVWVYNTYLGTPITTGEDKSVMVMTLIIITLIQLINPILAGVGFWLYNRRYRDKISPAVKSLQWAVIGILLMVLVMWMFFMSTESLVVITLAWLVISGLMWDIHRFIHGARKALVTRWSRAFKLGIFSLSLVFLGVVIIRAGIGYTVDPTLQMLSRVADMLFGPLKIILVTSFFWGIWGVIRGIGRESLRLGSLAVAYAYVVVELVLWYQASSHGGVRYMILHNPWLMSLVAVVWIGVLGVKWVGKER